MTCNGTIKLYCFYVKPQTITKAAPVEIRLTEPLFSANQVRPCGGIQEVGSFNDLYKQMNTVAIKEIIEVSAEAAFYLIILPMLVILPDSWLKALFQKV
jgi:hypothetical protein